MHNPPPNTTAKVNRCCCPLLCRRRQIVERESRNHQFDFLRPQHTMFNYFMQLTDQYRKIIIPKAEMLNSLK